MKIQLKILPHQTRAIGAVTRVFKDVEINNKNSIYENLEIKVEDKKIVENIEDIQKGNFDEEIKIERIYRETVQNETFGIDVKMETGTGKTYCYTRLMYELNKNYGFNKFIILVPSTPIKEGTKNFIEAEYSKTHFADLYPDTFLKLEVLNAQNTKKKGKKMFPQAISNFTRTTRLEKNKITCLLMTDKMLQSKATMDKDYDQVLFGNLTNPYKALEEVKPIVIIDEPHRFKRENKAYQCLLNKINPQVIIRFGATFDKNEKTGKRDYNNLVYNLDSISAFNDGLVKGVAIQTLDNISEEDTKIKLMEITTSKPKIAVFKNEKTGKNIKLNIGDSLSEVAKEFFGITILEIGKIENYDIKSGVLLSNEKALVVGESIFANIYSETYQELMLKQALKNHFSQEKLNFLRKRKIKTLSLFFIDSVFSYRGDNNDGELKTKFETLLKLELENQIKRLKLKILERLEKEYLEYLECSLKNIRETSGGYFSIDNSTKDEEIQKEIDLILRDKEKLLSFKNSNGNWNVMRFVFSKWTLREGWDNPNVFQIVKLRSSGSENSKLQEVGRGLRLPVDEYGNRISEEDFYLTYLIDFSEKDFAKKLITEINLDKEKIKNIDKRLEKVAKERGTTQEELFMELFSKKYIDMDRNIIEENITIFFEKYPEFNQGIKIGKIIDTTQKNKNYIKVREDNFDRLKSLWETINSKYYLTLEKLSEEELFNGIKEILTGEIYTPKIVRSSIEKISIEDSKLRIIEEVGEAYIIENKMPYNEFLKKLNKATGFSLPLLHKGFLELDNKEKLQEDFFNSDTLKKIVLRYQNWIETIFFNKYTYKKIKILKKETVLTDVDGNIKKKILQSNLGIYRDDNFKVSEKFLYDTLIYDSPLEKENIKNSNIDEVIVFGKIPRRSIRVPLYFGGTTSPDFMYVLKKGDGSLEMNLIVETKGIKNKSELREVEKLKINNAKKFFEIIGNEGINIKFEEQLNQNDIIEIINKVSE